MRLDKGGGIWARGLDEIRMWSSSPHQGVVRLDKGGGIWLAVKRLQIHGVLDRVVVVHQRANCLNGLKEWDVDPAEHLAPAHEPVSRSQ